MPVGLTQCHNAALCIPESAARSLFFKWVCALLFFCHLAKNQSKQCDVMLCNKRRQADAEVRAVCQNTKQLTVTVPDEAQRESDAEDEGRGKPATWKHTASRGLTHTRYPLLKSTSSSNSHFKILYFWDAKMTLINNPAARKRKCGHEPFSRLLSSIRVFQI